MDRPLVVVMGEDQWVIGKRHLSCVQENDGTQKNDDDADDTQ